MLSPDDSALLNHIIESTNLTDYHEEFQELANYLRYLFDNHKTEFEHELYRVAPITEYRDVAIRQQRNYSETLLDAMCKSPQALEDLVGSEQMLFISKFLVMQYATGKLYLPTTFLSFLLNLTKKDSFSVKYTNKRLESALALPEESFKNRGTTHIMYKDKSKLSAFNEFEQNDLHEYVHTQCIVKIAEEVVEQYKDYILSHNQL
jgi:hypothetical protein